MILADGSIKLVTSDRILSADELDQVLPKSDDLRLSAAKAECRARIYAHASAEAQMNMATAAAIASGVPEPDRSPDQVSLLAGVTAALEWVAAMRATAAALAENPDADITADASWPPVPPEAAAVAAMF
ncbi:hypothetical protein [Maritimibacter sp. HL-12]|uniref:hypothetical protein n=1 Tax=Maritimibacter sp. HL-12 TaxID=1162418 RepID=UPI00111C91D0|nr:hypothetical protein [Maritimibacter sp. HL-12]